jgi:glutaredoxin
MGRYHPKRLLFAALVLLLLYAHVRHSQNDDFYTNTVKALNKKSKDKAWKEETDAKVQQILRDKSSLQITSSRSQEGLVSEAPVHHSPGPLNPLQPLYQPKIETEHSVAYSTDTPDTRLKSLRTISSDLSSTMTSETSIPPYLARVRASLNEIIRQHSIVIFSKSYCPHSRRAKSLLLETYDIDPIPYVVELDKMTEPANNVDTAQGGEADRNESLTMGKALQNLLAERTGRTTVPNILVLGRSIGGADEVVTLDEEDKLAAKLKGMIGKRLQRCERREARDREELKAPL